MVQGQAWESSPNSPNHTNLADYAISYDDANQTHTLTNYTTQTRTIYNLVTHTFLTESITDPQATTTEGFFITKEDGSYELFTLVLSGTQMALDVIERDGKQYYRFQDLNNTTDGILIEYEKNTDDSFGRLTRYRTAPEPRSQTRLIDYAITYDDANQIQILEDFAQETRTVYNLVTHAYERHLIDADKYRNGFFIVLTDGSFKELTSIPPFSVDLTGTPIALYFITINPKTN